MASLFQRYLLPGLVFQGIVIGGGYATGRELAEFFLPHGAIGGLLGLAATALVWGIVMAISFELCRTTGSYDYRHFFRQLLGRAWFLYEILFVLLMIVILAVVGSASGEILFNITGAPPAAGMVLLLIAIGLMVFYGGALMEIFMGGWSLLLYASFATLVLWSFNEFGGDIAQSMRAGTVNSGWLYDGLRYAGYNIAVVPMVFFCIKHLARRREAICSGLLAGIIGILPAVFLFTAMLGAMEETAAAAIPSAVLLQRLDSHWFEILFQLVLLGTLVQTGAGIIHSVNERVAAALQETGRRLPRPVRPMIACLLLLAALLLGSVFGLITLIANGYGLLTFGFLLVFVVPVLTVGLARVWFSGRGRAFSGRL